MHNRFPKSRYFSPDPYAAEVNTFWAEALIAEALAREDYNKAREAALCWAKALSDRLGCEFTGNWKFFKRSLAAKWFGAAENRRFAAYWNPEEVLQYANSLTERSIRISIFPDNIACHAVSLRIPAGRPIELASTVTSLDRETPIEIFPESSNERTICFRRFTSQFGEEIFYEAGTGQAMLVFESEQGKHPLVRAIRVSDTTFEFVVAEEVTEDSSSSIHSRLQQLIYLHEESFLRKSFGMCRYLGIEFLSIEGYYDHLYNRLTVVDIDLPLDAIFMHPSPTT